MSIRNVQAANQQQTANFNARMRQYAQDLNKISAQTANSDLARLRDYYLQRQKMAEELAKKVAATEAEMSKR